MLTEQCSSRFCQLSEQWIGILDAGLVQELGVDQVVRFHDHQCAAMMSGIGTWVSSKYQGITESELEGPEGIFQLFKLNPTDTSRTK